MFTDIEGYTTLMFLIYTLTGRSSLEIQIIL